MKNRRSFWPFLGAILLFTANVDWILIPFVLMPVDVPFWAMFWITILVANLEILGWFCFWRWFAWTWLPKTEPVKDTIELTENIIDLLRQHGLLGTIIYKTRETFQWATDSDRKGTLKKWGHAWMFFWGAEPLFAGGRLLGVVSCAATRWKAGLISLCIGNTIHVYISIKSWDLIFYLWDEHRRLSTAFVVLAALFLVGRYFWKRLKRKHTKNMEVP